MEIKLKKIELVFVSIFEKTSNPFNNELSYRTAFKYEGKAFNNTGVVSRGEQNLYNANSKLKTAVLPKIKTAQNYLNLSNNIAIAKNCNIELDRIFRNMVVDAIVETYNYHYEDRHGVGLFLKEIHICNLEFAKRVLSSSSDGQTK